MTESLETWAILEIMGHQKFAGFLTEATIAGSAFVRIDVPKVTLKDGRILPPFTKLFGPSSIYAMTPCTEETALAWVSQLRQRAFSEYEAPRLPAIDSPKQSGLGAGLLVDLDSDDEGEF